jgi:hypothetical protein
LINLIPRPPPPADAFPNFPLAFINDDITRESRATADEGNEPIYVRQYAFDGGAFGKIIRTATLLDASGNTLFPGIVTASAFSGNASSATKATQDGSGNVITSTYLPISGGTLTGHLKWNENSLPTTASLSYILGIDSFASGGTTYWCDANNDIKESSDTLTTLVASALWRRPTRDEASDYVFKNKSRKYTIPNADKLLSLLESKSIDLQTIKASIDDFNRLSTWAEEVGQEDPVELTTPQLNSNLSYYAASSLPDSPNVNMLISLEIFAIQNLSLIYFMDILLAKH